MQHDGTRRWLLRLLMGGLGVGLFPLGVFGAADPGETLRSGSFRELIPNAASAIAIGRQALADQVVEREGLALMAGLEIDSASLAGSAEEIEALRGRLRERSREDFRRGRTRMLRGWVLSETELRLAALIALESGA